MFTKELTKYLIKVPLPVPCESLLKTIDVPIFKLVLPPCDINLEYMKILDFQKQ